MPLPGAHTLFGAAIVAAVHSKRTERGILIPVVIGGFLAITADFDFILVILAGDELWHRGFSHSVLFSLLIYVAVFAFWGRGTIRDATAFGLAYFSHVFLDFVTTRRGGGLQLFWFFSDERYKLGWVGFSERPSELPLAELLQVIAVEIAVFGLLLLITLRIRKFFFDDELSILSR